MTEDQWAALRDHFSTQRRNEDHANAARASKKAALAAKLKTAALNKQAKAGEKK